METTNKTGFRKFPSIRHPRDFARAVEWLNAPAPEDAEHSKAPPLGHLLLRSKIKLHGTNASVRIGSDGKIVGQKRSGDIPMNDDHLGFAKWMRQNKDWFSQTFKGLAAPGMDACVYGEWAGPGIQKGVAVTKMKEKAFFVYALNLPVPKASQEEAQLAWLVDPEAIQNMIAAQEESHKVLRPQGVHVLPWHRESLALDSSQPEGFAKELAEVIEEASKEAEQIGECDPYIKATFGIEGTGEGLVYYTLSGSEDPLAGSIRRQNFGLVFKVKNEKHAVVDRKKFPKASAEPTEIELKFVEAYLTPARLEQGIFEVAGDDFQAKDIGAFLKWIGQDVLKEGQADMDELDIEWKRVARIVNRTAATYAKTQLSSV